MRSQIFKYVSAVLLLLAVFIAGYFAGETSASHDFLKRADVTDRQIDNAIAAISATLSHESIRDDIKKLRRDMCQALDTGTCPQE